MISVLLVDDNGPVRESLHSLLESEEDIRVVATAADGVDAVDKARSHRPDIVVMDISMPLMDGIEATEHIRECFRLTRVILVTGFDTPEYVQRAIEVGAKGYMLKDEAGEVLLEAIRSIHRGNHYFSQKIQEVAEKYLSWKEIYSWAAE